MSKTTKTRYLTHLFESNYILPKEDELIGKITGACGRDLYGVIDSNGEEYLASMPTRFRSAIYVRRQQFVYLIPIEEGRKVRAEISHILDAKTVLYARELNLWPELFEQEAASLEHRSGQTYTNGIDDDMLPPAYDSDAESSSADQSDAENNDTAGDFEHETNNYYNPNHR